MQKVLILATFLLFLLSNSAFAIPWTMDSYNNFVDLSAERLVNADGTEDNTLLETGDKLRGVFRVDELTSPTSIDLNPPTYPELTGIFELEVKDRTRIDNTDVSWSLSDDENVHGISQGDSLNTDLYSYTFGASSSFEDTYGSGALAAFYIDDEHDFQATGEPPDGGISVTESENNVTDGSLYWTFGLGNTGEWIIDSAPEDVEAFKYADSQTTLGSTQVGLNLLSNPNGPPLVRKVGFENNDGDLVNVDMRANLTLLGIGDEITNFDLKNKFDGRIYPTPEPTTLLLFGTGLLGLAAFGRKKFMRKS